jgi:hypothetical protein
VVKTEAEGTASFAFVHGEADEFTQKVALLEGELADARQAQDTVEVNFQGLSDGVANVNRL